MYVCMYVFVSHFQKAKLVSRLLYELIQCCARFPCRRRLQLNTNNHHCSFVRLFL